MEDILPNLVFYWISKYSCPTNRQPSWSVSNLLAGCYEKSEDSLENIRCHSVRLESCPAILSPAKFLQKSAKEAAADFIISNVLFWSVNKRGRVVCASVEGVEGCSRKFGAGRLGFAPWQSSDCRGEAVPFNRMEAGSGGHRLCSLACTSGGLWASRGHAVHHCS